MTNNEAVAYLANSIDAALRDEDPELSLEALIEYTARLYARTDPRLVDEGARKLVERVAYYRRTGGYQG